MQMHIHLLELLSQDLYVIVWFETFYELRDKVLTSSSVTVPDCGEGRHKTPKRDPSSTLELRPRVTSGQLVFRNPTLGSVYCRNDK